MQHKSDRHPVSRSLLWETVGTSLGSELEYAYSSSLLPHILLPAFEATLWNVLHVRTQHRMYRLLVRVARSADRAPVSEAELRSALGTHASDLDGDAWTLAIQYERLNERRLRFVVREDSPLTPHLRKQVARYLVNPGARSKSWDARPLHITARAVELQLAR